MYGKWWLIYCILALQELVVAQKNNKNTPSPSSPPSILSSGKPSSVLSEKPSYVPSNGSQSHLPTWVPTSSPTQQSLPPSIQPSSLFPTQVRQSLSPVPTFQPSDGPTLQPTQLPSLQSSTAQSEAPFPKLSKLPVSYPSQLPSTTFSPSDALSAAPSSVPTHVPSSVPTSLKGILLPPIQLKFELSSPSATIDRSQLETEMNSFLAELLLPGASSRSFEALDTHIDLQNGIEAGITGQVYYRGEGKPTYEELKRQLSTYFSFWGNNDLMTHLSDAGIPVKSVTIEVDGVQMATNEEVPNFSVSSSNSDDDDKQWKAGIIAGAVAAGACVVGLIAFSQRGRWMGSRGYPQQNSPSRGSHGGNEARTLGASPRGGYSAPLSAVSADDLISDGGLSAMYSVEDSLFTTNADTGMVSESGLSAMYSVEDSLFTTNADADVVKGPPSNFRYDASRLDQVISDAKFTSEMAD
jgi:hypothetical protein